jgi:inhibitor of KinA
MHSDTRDVRIVRAGDSLLIIELENTIDPHVNQRAIALADAIETLRIGGVTDVVPTYRSVGVYFDPVRTHHDRLIALLDQCTHRADVVASEHRLVEVPVVYGGAFGPDLASVAEQTQLTEDEVIRRHVSIVYRVYMLGFVPGFAYMGTVDERLRLPRRQTPRLRVPACSVAIASFQTGIYPADTPGGWWILGRSVMKPFDTERKDPFLFRAGDSVRFVSVDASELQEPRHGGDQN